MKKSLAAGVAFAMATAWASSAMAFEPVPYKEVPGLVGKPVYAAANVRAGEGAWVYAGEPLTLVAAPVFQQKGAHAIYNYVRVKTAEGKEGEVQIRFLSKAPLKFNLRSPGSVQKLLSGLFADAYEIPAKLHALESKHGYNIDSEAHPDEYHLSDSMREAFRFERMLLKSFRIGAMRSKEDVMREDDTKWLAKAPDGNLLDAYADGIQDKGLKAKVVNADDALGTLDNVHGFGADLARLEQEKAEKRWRRDMNDVPQDKLAKLDQEKLGEIAKEGERRKKQIKDAFARAAADKARAL